MSPAGDRPRPGRPPEPEDWGEDDTETQGWAPGGSRRGSFAPLARRLGVIAAVVLVAAGLLAGAWLLPAQVPTRAVGGPPLVGRTATVCPVIEDRTGERADTATLTAVAIRQAPGRSGVLTGEPLAGGEPLLTVDAQGRGAQLASPQTPVLLRGEGVMATASSGAVVSYAERGELTGLTAAPCTPPSTSHWFVGVGADDDRRTEIVLSNPDDAQAQVDLRFYGRAGLVVVPGSPGLVVPAHASRTVSLPSLVAESGPLSVWVRATTGRVSAMARDLYSVGLDPAGADWHPASAPPARTVVLAGVPGGQGTRELQVVNPGPDRAVVRISVLGVQGPLSPVGAEQLEVPGESTATVALAAGLAGQAAGVRLDSDQPVTGAVISTTSRADAGSGAAALPDIAVQPAAAAMGRTGVSPVATWAGTDSELIVSNGSAADAQVSFEVFSLDGVSLRTDSMLVPAGGTSIRGLDSAAPSYLVVSSPSGADLYAAVSIAQSEGAVAGLTGLAVSSPDVAARARAAEPDPAVGR